MDVISLASGFGLFDWALRDAGLNIRFQCECGKFQTSVLNSAFQDSIKHNDIFKLTKKEFDKHGIDTTKCAFVGGLCCQPFSTAGPQKGKNKDTWMVERLEQLTRDCNPRFVLVENVAGFIKHPDGYDDLATRMENLNYTGNAICIPASAFGAPHQRQRIFALYARDKFILSDPSSLRRYIGEIKNMPSCQEIKPGYWNGRNISKPGIRRMAYGNSTGNVGNNFKHDVHRLKCAGNAVVYSVGLFIGKKLKETNDLFYNTNAFRNISKSTNA